MKNLYPKYLKNKTGTVVYKIDDLNKFVLVRLRHVDKEMIDIAVEGMNGMSAHHIIDQLLHDKDMEPADKTAFNHLLNVAKNKLVTMYDKLIVINPA